MYENKDKLREPSTGVLTIKEGSHMHSWVLRVPNNTILKTKDIIF
jgi:hypothetical protein